MINRRTLLRQGGSLAAVTGLALTGLARLARAPHIAHAGTGTRGLLVVGDTVRAGASVTAEEAPFLACVQQNRFPQGTGITFRMRAIDLDTGAQLTPAQVAVTLTLPDGTVREFGYHPLDMGRSPDSAFVLAQPIPADYPTGAFDVTVEATDREGRRGVWQPFLAGSSTLQIVPAGQR